MDLEPLKIDRSAAPRRKPARGGPRWLKPAIAIAVVVGLAWLFRAPILGFVDRWTLSEVRTVRVTKRSPAAVATVSGASANGYIVPKTRAALSADTPGRIVAMNVEEGSVVKRGQVVARLYAEEYEAELRRAEADLAVAEAAHTRALAEATVAQSALESLRAVEKASGADLGQYQAALELEVLEYDRAVHLLENQVDTVQARDRAKSELDSARARLAWAQANLDTARMNVAQGGAQIEVVRAAVQESLARLEVARAARDLAKATLEKTEIRAPFDGIVVLKDAEVGEVVSPNVVGGTSARGSVVTMVDFDSLEVQAEVAETSLAAVRIGAGAKIYLDAYPEKPYPGRVDRIWPTANRTKATVEVRITFEHRDDRLRPEMGVRVVFADPAAPATLDGAAPSDGSDAPAVVLIPSEAVVKIAGESGVFVLERAVVLFRKVALGEERSGKVIVRQGLEEGETIVLAPPASLKDGDRVQVVQK